MGLFSFLDADTNKSIPVDSYVSVHLPSDWPDSTPKKFLKKNEQYKNLLLLNQIQGHYDGYGKIHNGVSLMRVLPPANIDGIDPLDVYAMLYVMNYASLKLPDVSTEDEARDIGLMINMGSVYQDKDGNNHHFHWNPNEMGVKSTQFNGGFDVVQEPSGKTPNDLIESGEWIEKKIVPVTPFPLKITSEPADENGLVYKYEHLNASEDCPNQGFFY